MSRSKANKHNKKFHQNDVVDFKSYKRQRELKVLPRNLEQEDYLDLLENENIPIVVAYGKAGTGKSFLACAYAAREYAAGKIDKIVITRPNISVDDEGLGALPGGILEKMAPWVAPVTDALQELGYTKDELVKMMEDAVIEVVPVAYLRGRTFRNAVVIGDEAQNLTKTAMLSFLTRIGENSKMILTGDVSQSDRSRDNGLSLLISKANEAESIGMLELKKVERHPVIEEVLRLFA